MKEYKAKKKYIFLIGQSYWAIYEREKRKGVLRNIFNRWKQVNTVDIIYSKDRTFKEAERIAFLKVLHILTLYQFNNYF